MNKLYTALLASFFVILIAGFFTIRSTKNKVNDSNTASYKNISAQELKAALDKDKDIFLLDVHIPEQKHINGTDEFIPFNDIESNISKLPQDKNREIVVYCRSGNMSETAAEELIEMGYKNVKNLTGGTINWFSEGNSNE